MRGGRLLRDRLDLNIPFSSPSISVSATACVGFGFFITYYFGIMEWEGGGEGVKGRSVSSYIVMNTV